MPTLPAFDLELLGERLAELETETVKLRRGPLCDALQLAFFDIEIKPDKTLVARYRCPRCQEWFGAAPQSMDEALRFVHPADQAFLNAGPEFFCRIRLRGANGSFSWFMAKQIFMPDRWVGVIFKAPENVLGFNFEEYPNEKGPEKGPFAS
jgi:hypothetical protein